MHEATSSSDLLMTVSTKTKLKGGGDLTAMLFRKIDTA